MVQGLNQNNPPLLDLSDSDSYLMPDVCKTVAVRLRQLIRNWPDEYIDKNKRSLSGRRDGTSTLTK